MRKSILAMFVVMIAMFAVACGGNKPAGNGGDANAANGGGTGGGCTAKEVDVYALYKKKDRTWTHKNDFGGNVSHMKVQVVDVKDDHAMTKTWMLDKDMKAMAGMPEPEPVKVEFKKVEAPKDGTKCAPKVETKDETIKVAAGEFECTWTKTGDTETWMAKKYPGLIVKSKMAAGTMELVEFKD
ncbi:hypothetical protein PLCT2_01830 [Planctomycetaceae bacterium]|nr:hypothetical protein PLCT2_01830 [Planctomycetaceae bacterium]